LGAGQLLVKIQQLIGCSVTPQQKKGKDANTLRHSAKDVCDVGHT
jgi:hypothetical protein